MKHIVITLAFFIVIFRGFAQDNVFTVIDILSEKANYMILSCRDDYGRTIQFQVVKGNPAFDKRTNKAINPPTVGSKVIADFVRATVSPANYNFIKYKILKPSYSVQCCSIKGIQYFMSSLSSVYARIFFSNTNAPNEVSSFTISSPFTSNIQHVTIGQPVYEKYYNKKKYEVLKPWSEEEINKNIFYSYEFYVASNNPPNSTDTSQGTTSNEVDSTMFNEIFNQPWEITGGSSLPGSGNSPSGFLSVNAPEDAACTTNIYNNTTHSLFTSTDKRFLSMLTGTWDVEISGVMVKNVPIYGLKTTRIKAGTLNIVPGSPWTLYDSTKIKNLYSSTVSKKVEFPRGTYQLEINGTTQQIQIKDGETLQIGDSSQAPQTQKLNTSTQPWEIQLDPTIKGIGGEIVMQIPKFDGFNTNLEFFNAGEKTNRQASWFGNNKAKLLPGIYDVVIDDRDTIKNVPVELGKQTRLKMGVFYMGGYSDANLENSVTHQKFTYGAPFKILLPEGTYYLNKNKKVPIVIKNGELTEL